MRSLCSWVDNEEEGLGSTCHRGQNGKGGWGTHVPRCLSLWAQRWRGQQFPLPCPLCWQRIRLPRWHSANFLTTLPPSHSKQRACASRAQAALGAGEFKDEVRTSLVTQWLRICLPMQGTWVRALVREDPTCHGASRPVRHNY